MSEYLELARLAARKNGLSAVDERNEVNELSRAQKTAGATRGGLISFNSERSDSAPEQERFTAPGALYELLRAARLAGIELAVNGGELSMTGADSAPTLRDSLLALADELVVRLKRFSNWVPRCDAVGVLGWEPPDVPEESRWWSRSAWPQNRLD
jgi:hypothetical protein